MTPAADWVSQDWQSYYDERAAIMQHDGVMSRAKAEKEAWADLLTAYCLTHNVGLTRGRAALRQMGVRP